MGRSRTLCLLFNRKGFFIFHFAAIFCISICYYSCSFHPHPPPPTKACTFTLSNIFSTCHNPTSSSGIIKYSVNFLVYYYNGSTRNTLDEQNLNSATTPSTTMTINSKVPSDGTTFQVEATLTGTQCAKCALTQYGNSTCLQLPSGSGYTAGVPRWHFLSGPIVYGNSTFSVLNWIHIDNVSCGCVVPN
jgi:hypothetical protein